MSDLIDGVIAAGSAVGVQCLQFVNNVTHGGGAGYGSAGQLEAAAQAGGFLHSVPSLGDIAVWGNHQGGAGSSGHAALVTGLGSGGEVAVTGTNWPGGSGATQYIVGHNPVGIGAPSGYITPSSVGGTNILGGGGGSVPTLANDGSGMLATGPGPGWKVGPWQVFSGSGLNRIGFSVAGVAMIAIGLFVLFRKEATQVIAAGAKVAA